MTREQPAPADDQWTECPAGEIGGLVQGLQARRHRETRRETLRRAATGVTCLAILVVTGVYAVPHFALVEPSFGGITCSELRSLADEYIAGRLDGGMTARIDAHLAACGHCQAFMANLRGKLALPPEEAVGHRQQAAVLIAQRQ